MARIELILTMQPFVPNLAIVDTGAEVSLFPRRGLKDAEYKLLEDEITIEQAGIAKHTFQAIEAEINLRLEDLQGNTTPEL